jgi:KipI family sensor histidine kinase inhibitor
MDGPPEVEVLYFGDSAILVDAPSADSEELMRALRELDEVKEVLAGAVACVLVAPGQVAALAPKVEAVARQLANRTRAGSPATTGPSKEIEIPVEFDGPDLEEVATSAGMSVRQVIEALCGARLRVAYLGFAPGFAYVTGLPGPLANLARRKSPRTSVPAGSVAIAGGYLGIYPQASPGGWNLVGRTDTPMFDPEAPPYSTLRPGDVVKLSPTVGLGEVRPPAMPSKRPRSDSPRRIEVLEPGALTTLQDLGRVGVAYLGVPSAGPADSDSMRLANVVAGNPQGRGVLETTLSGPTLRFCSEAHAVCVGAGAELNGRAVEPGVVFEVPAGGVLRIAATSELRGYLAVSGGIKGPELFGSVSSDLLCGLGPGPLRAGDELDLGEPGRPRGYAPALSRNPTVRLLPGPEAVDTDSLARWIREPFAVSPDSNRIGVRLTGSRPVELLAPPRGSYGMVPGAVQIPPSGEPIVLLCDHATMGGYPVVATVISADIGEVAQLRPGDEVYFELVDLEEAIEARHALDRQIERAPTGIFPAAPIT